MNQSENVVFQKEKIEISAKKIGKSSKKFIKTNSEDYSKHLKEEVLNNFKINYDSINDQIMEEQNNQEKQQKDLKEQCDNNLKGNNEINDILSRRQRFC